MRILFFILILFFLSSIAKAADLYTSIKSSLNETIHDGFQIQLIDANIPGLYILFEAGGSTELEDTFFSISEELSKQGFKLSYSKNPLKHQVIVKLPKEQLDTILQRLLEKFSSSKLSSIEIIVFGGINQQRLLGIINRQYNSTNIEIAASSLSSFNENIVVLTPLEQDPANQQQSDWMIGLSSALMNCSYLEEGKISFSLFQQNKFICNNYSPNQSLTDKEVADLKDKLYSDIQLTIDTPVGFLHYISSFQSERRLELSQSFFNTLPALSIDSILEYHYKKLLNVQQEPIQEGEMLVSDSVYQLPSNYKIKSQFSPDRSKVIHFDLAIDSAYTCIQLNCASLAALPYIQYSASENMHLFSMRYPSFHETTVLSELNKVLFIPLSTSSSIAQENLLISLQGGYLLEAYDDSFRLMAKLPLVSININTSTHKELDQGSLNFNIRKDDVSLITIGLNSVPGGQHWEESELLYFILLSRHVGKDFKVRLNKSNTLVNPDLSSRVYLEVGSSPVYINLGYNELETTEELLKKSIQLLGSLPEELSRNDFVEFKKGIITNLSLLDGNNSASLQISHLFDLDRPNELLIQKLVNLSYEQFKAFLVQKVAFDRITITTSHDLDESFKNRLSELLRDS